MKMKLRSEPIDSLTTIEQICINRGIDRKECYHYLNTTDNDINDYNLLGENNLHAGAALIAKTISENGKALVVVDSDCDGFTSSAIIINYLFKVFPAWCKTNVFWVLHDGKQHGLKDHMNMILDNDFSLVICPDGASNDYEEHKILKDKNIQVLVLDHHEAEKVSENAVVINNQLSDYPNKDFSGAGIVYQFCRYLDKILNKDFADCFLDLVSTGNSGDMMDLRSIETKHLINKGLEPDRIVNPYIYGMWQKNSFKLGENPTSWGIVFYIVPMINAICRSGTIEEKELVFRSMLEMEAFKIVPSTKRGHGIGDTERIVDQALRTSTNVKNRQTKVQDVGMELLEKKIAAGGLLDNKILLFILQPGEMDEGIRGLAANKLMAKYQRPVCVLTESEDKCAGSARGYDKSGIADFKAVCEASECTEYAVGHANAFGLCIQKDQIDSFLRYTNEAFSAAAAEPIYYVDYCWKQNEIEADRILDIADMDYLWGTGFEESKIGLLNIHITKDNFKIMKNNTVKISLPTVDIVKFKATDEEIENFTVQAGYVEINALCKCKVNEWSGARNGQLELLEYEIVGRSLWEF